jgi:hypothetical protein
MRFAEGSRRRHQGQRVQKQCLRIDGSVEPRRIEPVTS